MFTRDVAHFRGVDIDAVVSGFGQGRVVSAETAVSLGMADRVATMDEVVNDLLRDGSVGKSAKARAEDTDWRLRRLRLNME